METEYTNGFDADQTVLRLPQDGQRQPVDYSHMISILAAWKDILNARLLALLVILGALGALIFVMYEPTTTRLYGMAIYAVLCLWPVMALYLRKG